MADPPATIYVHAQFPKQLLSNIDRHLHPANWGWAQCLAFPIEKLHKLGFSSKPYKWIRYATGVVIGAHGHLSAHCELPVDTIDYNSGLSTKTMHLYYHTTPKEKRLMFPIDPSVADPKVGTAAQTSPRRELFRHDVETRDRICVVTGSHAHLCQAAHILPHGKGDQYIETFSTRRHRGPIDGDNHIVNSIDDLRNCLFVNRNIHGALGHNVAFLKTPNFAMDTTDVDPNAGSEDEERLTNHLFDDSLQPHFGVGLPGQAIRIPSGDARKTWPPPSLFEAIYANAVIFHFGPIPMDAFNIWKDEFYGPDGAGKAAQTDDKRRHDLADAEEVNRQKQKTERQERHAHHRQ